MVLSFFSFSIKDIIIHCMYLGAKQVFQCVALYEFESIVFLIVIFFLQPPLQEITDFYVALLLIQLISTTLCHIPLEKNHKQ